MHSVASEYPGTVDVMCDFRYQMELVVEGPRTDEENSLGVVSSASTPYKCLSPRIHAGSHRSGVDSVDT